MRFLLFVCAIFLWGWVVNKREQKKEEEQRKLFEHQQELLKQSIKYNRLCEMLKALQFYCTPITLTLNSLNEFRRYNKAIAFDVAYSEICTKYKFFTDNNFWSKFHAVAILQSSDSEYVRKKEEEIYQLVDEAIHTSVKIIWSYTSPAGVNHYEDSAYITWVELQEYTRQRNLCQQHIDSEKYRHERERQMMTRSLRYEMLKRDNFRCQICGRTQADGVKLEVDHKKTIAKGGRTEPNNLWTLCQDCNRGKGAKYHISE